METFVFTMAAQLAAMREAASTFLSSYLPAEPCMAWVRMHHCTDKMMILLSFNFIRASVLAA